MALLIDILPDELVLVGSTVMAVKRQRARIYLSTDEAVLRVSDILSVWEATTPARIFYFEIQRMYVTGDFSDCELHIECYRVAGAPDDMGEDALRQVEEHAQAGANFKALQAARRVMELAECGAEGSLKPDCEEH